MKNRVGYFDIAKGIGIILVIIGHIEYMPLALREYIVTFHMPAFFVISGMLMNLTNEKDRSAKVLIKHKLQRIMIPYFVFSVIYPVFELIKYGITGEGYSTKLFIQELLVGLSMTGVSVLWFLPALFFSELIVLYFIKNRKRPVFIVIGIAVLTGAWFLAFPIPSMALFLWRTIYCTVLVLFGYMLYPAVNRAAGIPVLSILLSVAMFVILAFTGPANDIVDLHYIVTGNIFLYYTNALMGSIALILLSAVIDRYAAKPFSGAIRFYGQHSLFIMLTHMNFMILFVAEKIAFWLSGIVPRGKDLIFNLTAVSVTILIETVLILLWNGLKNQLKKKQAVTA